MNKNILIVLFILFIFVNAFAGWFDSNWLYRKVIVIDNTGNAKTLANYQDTIILRSANTDFSKIDEYGRDIRITDVNGITLIDHKINAWNEAAGCTLTFEVPSITASALDTIYMYYGYTGSINLKFGIMTDAHGITTPWARTYGTFAVQNIDTFVNRMDNFFKPNFIVGLGDWKVDINHATDSAALFAVKTAYNALDSAHYYVMGNHDTINIGEALFCGVTGIDSARIGFDKGNYHIICIRTGATAVISSADSAWIVDNLAATSKKCLLFIHQPLDDQDSALNFYFNGGSNLISNRANIRAKLESSGKVAAVFQGHYHWKYISNIGGIPYFTVTSIIEANSKKYAQATIYGDQYLVVDFKQGSGVTTDMIVWDFVNKVWVNNGDSVYLKYDDFDGGKPGWSELAGRTAGIWDIHANYGALIEYGALWNHRILKSTFNDLDSCIIEWEYLDTMILGSDYLGGVSSCISDQNNFRSFYGCTDGTAVWKEMISGSWTSVKVKASVFTPSTNWIKSKLIKVDSTYKFYIGGNLAYDTTKKSLSNASFGLWNYGTPLCYNNLKIRKYANPEPIVILGGTDTTKTIKWQGSISTNAATAGNYCPVVIPDLLDTVYIDSGAVNWELSSVMSIGHLKIQNGYTGTVKYNDTLHVNYLSIAADSSLFTKPIIARDSVVFSGTSIPMAYSGSRIQSTPGYTLMIKLGGKTNTPRVVNKSKIKWQ